MKRNERRSAHRNRADAQNEFDEIDASVFFGGSKQVRRETRSLQLCRQVQRVLNSALSGECSDPVLQDLVVDSVVPAPNASRVLANVYPATLAGTTTAGEILARLASVDGFLRREVARSIVRKRVPEIVFNVIAVEGGGREHA